MEHPDAPVAPSVRTFPPSLDGVCHLLAVSSGKGGVGKSTTAVNLALALADTGWRVGLLDADIHGPSALAMLGMQGSRAVVADEGRTLHPLVAHGIPLMSVAALMADDQAPLAWRGAMASQVLEQMLRCTRWGELDCLVIDMPPGTGDVPLSLCQRAPLRGALIVTTPQDVALLDVERGLAMLTKAGVPVLGVVENMAVHVCSHCGHASHPFGQGGADQLAGRFDGLQVLALLPLDRAVREQGDAGMPIVRSAPQSEAATRYGALACGVRAALEADDPRRDPVASPGVGMRVEVCPDS